MRAAQPTEHTRSSSDILHAHGRENDRAVAAGATHRAGEIDRFFISASGVRRRLRLDACQRHVLRNRSCRILVRLGSSGLLLRVWLGLLTLAHSFGFLCAFLRLGGFVVNRCLQIAGTEGCGGSCGCTPFVARDSLGLVVRSRRRRRRAELPFAVGIGLNAERGACAAPGVAGGLTLAFVSARVGSVRTTELCPGRVKSGHLRLR